MGDPRDTAVQLPQGVEAIVMHLNEVADPDLPPAIA